MNPLLFAQLLKIDVEQRLVWAVAACEDPDRSGEIYDYASSKPEVQAWSDGIFKTSGGQSYGNVRAMHNRISAGKIVEPIVFDDQAKEVRVCLKVVDNDEWDKVKEGIYTGLSFGGSYKGAKWPDAARPSYKRYTAAPSEVSLADLPCIPGATFTMIKTAGEEVVVPFKKIEARADVTPGTGTSKYGDVKFADEKNKKYPIDTAAHVRNAASRFGDPKNRAKYSAEDQKTIAAHIDAAKKKFGIGATSEKTLQIFADMLAKIDALIENKTFKKGAGADKTAQLVTVRTDLGQVFVKVTAAKENSQRLAKGMWGVSSLAQAVATIDDITRSAEYEQSAEGDESEVPAKLAEIRSQLGEVLVLMAQEETDELNPEEDNVEKLAKILEDLEAVLKTMDKATLAKAVSGKNMEHVQAIHDKTVELGASHNGTHDGELEKDGYTKPGDGDEPSEKLAKIIAKAVTDATAPLVDRLAKVEALPASVAGGGPAAVAADVLEKAAGAGIFKPTGLGVGGGEAAMKAAPVLALIKAAQGATVKQGAQGFDVVPGKGNLSKLAS